MNLPEIARLRLANQHLVGARLEKPSDVVATLGAVQAQDYPGAKWAVAQRTRDAIDATVEQALTDGSIVRTHVLRPTWHFVAPADIRWMLALTAPRIRAAMMYESRKLELHKAVFRRSGRALAQALKGGKHLTRGELSGVLRRTGIDVSVSQRLGHLLMDAELAGIVCSGARQGKQFTYALLEERIPAAAPIGRDEALLRLAKVYFSTRGPATATDFAWWSGLTVADAKKGVDLARSGLEHAIVDGQTYWFVSPATATTPSTAAHLLPNFDEYSVAYRDRSALTERLKKSRLHVRNDAVLANSVIVGGQFVGTWKRRFKENAAVVESKLLTSLRRSEHQAIAAAVRKYAEFLELPVELVS